MSVFHHGISDSAVFRPAAICLRKAMSLLP
jgi:hypothetical protein